MGQIDQDPAVNRLWDDDGFAAARRSNLGGGAVTSVSTLEVGTESTHKSSPTELLGSFVGSSTAPAEWQPEDRAEPGEPLPPHSYGGQPEDANLADLVVEDEDRETRDDLRYYGN